MGSPKEHRLLHRRRLVLRHLPRLPGAGGVPERPASEQPLQRPLGLGEHDEARELRRRGGLPERDLDEKPRPSHSAEDA